MQPLCLTIPGDYWDTYIYRGRLYLWDMSAQVRVIDMESAIKGLTTPQNRLALTCAYLNGELLYNPGDLEVVMNDADVRNVIRSKFRALSANALLIEESELQRHQLGIQDSPFGMHDDLAFYYNNIIATTDRGLYVAGAHKARARRFKIARKPIKVWDGLAYRVQSSRGGVALAAGDDGVFEYRYAQMDVASEPVRVASQHASCVDWAFSSIYASSSVESGFLVGFSWVPVEDEDEPSSYVRRERRFDRIYEEFEIFGRAPTGQHVSWGTQDKLYVADADGVRGRRFIQKNLTEPEGVPFIDLGTVADLSSFGVPLAAATAPFGVILEYQSFLLVISSGGEQVVIPGPVARWRAFPRSDLYKNQLHVVADDHVAIYSFNDDYFVDQRSKNVGTEHRTFRSGRFGGRAPSFTRPGESSLPAGGTQVAPSRPALPTDPDDIPF